MSRPALPYIIEGTGVRIPTLPGGGPVGGVVLTADLLGALGVRIIDGHLRQVAVPVDLHSTLAEACAQVVTASDRGDLEGVVRGFGNLARAVQARVGVHSLVMLDKGGGYTLKGLPEALRAGAAVYDSCAVLQQMDLGVTSQMLVTRADVLQHGAGLLSTHQASIDRMNTFVAPLAREGALWLRQVHRVASPLIEGDGELATLAQPMLTYLKDPVERAQQTKEHLNKAQEEITKKVTDKVESKARQDARTELEQMATDRLKHLFDGTPKGTPTP